MSDDQGSANPNIAQLLENNEVFSDLESDSADAASNLASPAVTPE